MKERSRIFVASCFVAATWSPSVLAADGDLRIVSAPTFRAAAGEPSPALQVHLRVQLRKAGSYVIFGDLWRDGRPIANRPSLQTALDSRAAIEGGPGLYEVTLKFSGGQIRSAGSDGPYVLRVAANDEVSAAMRWHEYRTPALRRADFGEE